MILSPLAAPLPPPPPAASPPPDRLREAGLALEAAFLREMLASAGLGRAPAAFGGGEGEDQFASVLLDAQARRLAEAGGVGLAESLVRALASREAAAGGAA
jgi:flagellar protein FlgJ